MGRGRKPKWETEEERLQAIKDSKMKYYKKNRVEILEKRKSDKKDIQTNKPNVTVYGSASEEIEEDVRYIPDGYNETGDYEGNIT